MASKIQGVLFDLGGTLIYFDGAWPEVMQSANQELLEYLQSQGIQLEPKLFMDEFRRRLEEYYIQREAEFIEYTTAHILRKLLEDLGQLNPSSEMLRPALKKLYAVSQAHWKLEADTISTLEALRSAGLRLAIVSNAADDADVQTLVDNAGIRTYFDFILSSAACGIRKPNPRIFEMALEKWGLKPEQAAVVGDTLGADILGARNAGLFSIWITRRADRPGNRAHADTIKPDAQIKTLSDLPEMLKTVDSEQSTVDSK